MLNRRDLMQDRENARTTKRQFSRGCFIEYTAQRKNIRALVQCLASGLFGRHVRDRAQNRTLAGKIGHRRSFHIDLFGQRTKHFCQTEVEHFRLTACRQQDVGGLDVAMNDFQRMGRGESVRYLFSNLEHLGKRDGAALNDVFQRLARNIFHDNEVETVVFIDRVDRNDVWMIERRSGAGLLNQAAFRGLVADCFRRQKLERNHSAQLLIFGLIDVAHAALTDLSDDTIMKKGFPGLEAHYKPQKGFCV